MPRRPSSSGPSARTSPAAFGGRSPLGGLEAVAHAGLGDEVAGVRRLGLELPAHLGHEHPEVVRLVVVLRPPHLLEELALGDESPTVPDEDLDEMPFGRGEAYLAAVAPYLLRRQVDREVAGLD